MEKTNISVTRGDTLTIVNKIYDSEGDEVVLGTGGKMYFTLKNDYDTEEFILQKTLDDGIEYVTDKGYVITLKSSDTATMDYGSYVFDIEVVQGDLVKTVAIGKLKLTNEVTFSSNEGSDE